MSKPDVQKYGLKASLLRIVIHLLLLLLAVVMTWSIALPWFGARQSGAYWAANSTRVAEALLKKLEIQNEQKFLRLSPDMNDEELSEELTVGETLIITRVGRAIRIFPRTEWNRASLFTEIHGPGYVRIGNDIAYASIGAIHKKMGKQILLHYVNDDVADHIAEITGNEVTVFSGPTVAASSWKDRHGKRVVPSIDEKTTRYVSDLPLSFVASFPETARYFVPDYQGANPDLAAFHRGESFFTVFQAFRPIFGSQYRLIGFISVEIPEDVVMNGPKKALIGSLLLLLILCTITIYFSIRYTDRLVAPLTKLANEIKELAEQTRKKYSKILPLRAGDAEPAGQSEIQLLEFALKSFKRELAVAEQLSTKVEEERARALAASKLAALGELATGIVHEINTPLTVVNCRVTELLNLTESGSISPEEVARIAQGIEDTVMRISNITKNVQIFARESTQEDFVTLPFRRILDDILDFFRENFKHKNINLSVDWLTSPDAKTSVRVRPVQLGQVIVNLLNNAKDAIADLPEKWVRIQCSTKDEQLIFSVTDSGKGISPEIREKIMKPFFTTKPVGKGTGLGLSISKTIIESHQGRLELDVSCTNTRFTVSIPLHQYSTLDNSKTIN
jgi:signal transduction histidine kinase